jgi:peptidoglycan/xylan/chitin deacetylase (PgdA/CDA1 family)
MGKRRILVGYGIDVDAVSTHINTTIGGEADLANISRGFFGATRGVERLLELFNKKNITCSWFIPGHTLETFPEDMAKIRDAGHEIGLHGYTHEYPADLSREQFEAVLVKTIDILTKFCGARPKGFVAPAWRNHPNQIELLEKYGIDYGKEQPACRQYRLMDLERRLVANFRVI